MNKVLLFSLGIFLLASCTGNQANNTQNGRVYLSQAAGNPELLEQFPCTNSGGQGVQICHVPPGNPAAKHTICIGHPAVDAHVGHHVAKNGEGDFLGACDGSGGTTGTTTGSTDGGTTGGDDGGTTTGTTTGGDTCQQCFACITAGGSIEQCTPPCNLDCF